MLQGKDVIERKVAQTDEAIEVFDRAQPQNPYTET